MFDFSFIPPCPEQDFNFFPGELAIFNAAPDITPAQWVQGERHVEISPCPGPADLETTPYLIGLLEWYGKEHVREMDIAGGSQSAKSFFMQSCLGYVAVNQPGPSIFVMQDRVTGSEIISDHLLPMIHKTPSLRVLRTTNPDDLSLRRLRLRNGMLVYLAWANSEGRLASKPCRYGFGDEIDLWPDSAFNKYMARFRAFEDSYKVVNACTVSTEDGRIWTRQKRADVCIEYRPICPHCGEANPMSFANVRWGEGIVDPAELGRKGSAWYECPSCLEKWDEEDRNTAVLAASYMPHRGWHSMCDNAPDRPSRIWAHIPPLLSRFVPFHKIAAAYLATMTEPSISSLVYFYNDCLGIPTPDDAEGEIVQESALYKRRQDYSPDGKSWQIPMAGIFLTGDADVQGNRIELEIVAWGAGHESWGIEYKTFHGDTAKQDIWDQLHNWAQTVTYMHESGAELRPFRIGIDIGYRTQQVEKFCQRSGLYLAHKGSSVKGKPLVPRKPSKTSKHHVYFYELGVDNGKDTLMSWLGVDESGPRCCHWHTGYDYEYFRMLCAERPKREKNKKTGKIEVCWTLRDGVVRNEALDIRVGNMAVMMICNPNYERISATLCKNQSHEKQSEVKKKMFTQSKGVTI